MLEELTLMGCYNFLRFEFDTSAVDLPLGGSVGLLLSKLAHLQMLILCHFNADIISSPSLVFIFQPFAYFLLNF